MHYVVHNPHDTQVSKIVEINGEPTSTSINGFECELVAQDGLSGTIKLRYIGAAATSARELFTADAAIVATFAKA
jgi:hypothetical protein